MKRLIFWMLTLLLLTMALTGGVVAYARTHSGDNPLSVYGIDICNGKPCFFDIVPGETSWQQATSKLAALTQHGLSIIESSSSSMKMRFGQTYIEMFASEDLQIVVSIQLQGSDIDARPRLGYFVAIFGPPFLIMFTDAGYPLLWYPNLAVETDYEDATGRLTPFGHTSEVYLGNTTQQENNIIIKWSGFNSLSR